MNISQLLSDVEVIDQKGNKDLLISDLKIDSREVVPGDLFVCLKGLQTDGHEYINEAVQRGAKAVITEKWIRSSGAEFEAAVPDTRLALPVISKNFYSNPTSKLVLYGVTGTNGKTTTTYLIESILKIGGQKTGLIGTVKGSIGDEDFKLKNTTPESVELQKIFSQMVDSQVQSVVMEVSSHALDMHRVDFCHFDVAVFTNLSQDHLDYHKDMEDYFRAKRMLFEYLDHEQMIKVINNDDQFGQKLLEKKDKRSLSFGQGEEVDYRAIGIQLEQTRTEYTLETAGKKYKVKLNLPGLFNVYNSLAATASCHSQGLTIDLILEGLASVNRVPGRFDLVEAGQDFLVVVDYAHTPDSLKQIINAAKEITSGKIITVFGCGGDRDRGKRRIMGNVGVKLSDFTIITSDNPRSEKPENIIQDILEGVNGKEDKSKYEVEIDRKKAIARAIELAKEDDMVIIAGKGHEEIQIFKDKQIPFSDRQVAELILKERL